MTEKIHTVKYKHLGGDVITKDGHSMFIQDVVTDLTRKAFLENDRVALQARITELEAERQWVSVEEPPDLDKPVLVIVCSSIRTIPCEQDELVTGFLTKDSQGLCWVIGNKTLAWDYDYNLDCEVVEWMPLPKDN